MDSIVILKLFLTPTLIALVTLISRRWGPVVGGWIIGLPLTSGPVSLFLALERGTEFASLAIVSTLLGLVATMLYAMTYACMARRFSWRPSIMAALCVNFLGVAALSTVTLTLVSATLLACAAILAALAVVKKADARPVAIRSPRWDLPVRMAVATTIVLLVTALSHSLGPNLSGILSTFPVFISIMAVFTHSANGAESARQFLRGVVIGSFSFVAFGVVVNLTLGHLGLPVVYMLAALAAVGVNGAVMMLFVHARHA